MAISRPKRPKTSQKSKSSSVARRVNRLVDRAINPDWLTLVENLPCDSWTWFVLAVRTGSSGRMSPESLHPSKGKRSGSSSQSLPNAGMAWRGEFLTLDISESPNGAVECSLSDVVDDPCSLERCYLSREQIENMIRRLEKYKQGTSLLAFKLRQVLSDGAETKRQSAEGR